MFDQLILEYWEPGEPNSGWVHVSHIRKRFNSNRKEYLMAFKDDNGKTEYKPILGLSTDLIRKVKKPRKFVEQPFTTLPENVGLSKS